MIRAALATLLLLLVPAAGAAGAPVGVDPALAAPADAFVDSVGVNTHFSYLDTVYRYLTTPAPSGNTIVSALLDLGVRHIRDGAMNTRRGAERCVIYRELFARGIDVDAIIDRTATAAKIADMSACLGPALFALEGPNELDDVMKFDPAFAQADLDEMNILRTARGTAFPAGVRLFGPSVVKQESALALAALRGDEIAAAIDYANGHVYFGARNPETRGWGRRSAFGVYGALTTSLAEMDSVSPGKPYVTTETGYQDDTDATGHGHLDAATKAKYILRDVLEQWRVGAKYTYIYEFAAGKGSWGLLDENLRPKPAYTALRNLLAILADPGPRIGSRGLGCTVIAPAHVQQVAFVKRDGSEWLALWQDRPGVDADSGAPLAVAPVTATLAFAVAPAQLRLFTVAPNTGSATMAALTPATSVELRVTDIPEIVQIGASRPPQLR
jgi:hypothetical protein